MTRPGRALRRGAVLAATAVVAATTAAMPAWVPAASAEPARSHGQVGDSVLITVDSVTPVTPTPTTAPRSLTVQLTLRNTTKAPLDKVEVIGERGDPISNQSALSRTISHPEPPAQALPIPPKTPVRVDLPAGGATPVTFTTTTSVIDGSAGLCLCASAKQPGLIYPLFFSAHVTGAGGVDQRLGVVATYLPAFYKRPSPVRVNWVWPLLDRPHRLASRTVFADDLLAGEVADEGRLALALDVVEQVGDSVPLTVVLDPEILDELEVMSSGKYTVSANGHSTPGTGQAAATQWLARLKGILAADPELSIQLTPYADPDVASVVKRGLGWAGGLPADVRAGVTDALGGRIPESTVAFPASGAIDQSTLKTLAGNGISTVLLNDAAVAPRPAAGAVPAGLARLHTGDTDVAAALTSAPLQKYAADAVSLGGPGAAVLPRLASELAIRAVQEPDNEHVAVIAAPRYVDPSVQSAVDAIRLTSRSSFSTPISLTDAASGTLLPTGRSHLAAVPASATTLPADIVDAVSYVESKRPAIAAMLDHRDPAVGTLLAALPEAVQRLESAAWRPGNNPSVGAVYAEQLRTLVLGITTGVRIVRPSSGSYTLASDTSPLPLTVENDLDYSVLVRPRVQTLNGLPGLTTKDIGVQTIEAKSKRTLHIPTKVDRSGRIRVEAQLLTPSPPDQELGDEVDLTVRSTALGAIGVIITIAAGVVLVLALLIRFVLRWRSRGRPDAADDANPGPTPDPTGPGAAGWPAPPPELVEQREPAS